jgi:hypothetical protein
MTATADPHALLFEVADAAEACELGLRELLDVGIGRLVSACGAGLDSGSWVAVSEQESRSFRPATVI